MKNPYFIDEPTGISLSGGRTSAYMLYKCLEAHDGVLPECAQVVFANTGKEMPATLDFVRDCADFWDVDIKWVELAGMQSEKVEGKTRNKLHKQYKYVTHETASRNGEPFDAYVNAVNSLPNPVHRGCTGSLKMRPIMWHMETMSGFDRPWQQFVGIRGDEKRRAIKIHNTEADGQERYCPLYLDGVTAGQVGEFWRNQSFDLALPNNNGVTDWGNCDLCYLKSASKKLSIIRERPSLADWWEDVEKRKGQPFRRDHPSYAQMKVIATDQPSLFDFGDDETIPCFCGD